MGFSYNFNFPFRLMTVPDFLCHLPKPLPIRDLRVFLRSRSSRSGTLSPHRKPTLVPRSATNIFVPVHQLSILFFSRPASGCYIFDIEHIRFLCYTDRCLILDPDRPLLQAFLNLLSSDLQLHGKGRTKARGPTHIRHLYQVTDQDISTSPPTFALPRTLHRPVQTLSTLCWKLPWPALSTSSTGRLS